MSFINDIIGGATTIAPYAHTAIDVAQDPALPEVIGLINSIPSSPDAYTYTQSSEPGVGLKYLIPPLRIYIAYKKQPLLVGAAAIGLVFGIPFALGYMFGKKR